jgi:hypothetical protein
MFPAAFCCSSFRLAAVEMVLQAGMPTKIHVLNLLHRLVDGGPIAAPDLDPPQALILRKEPKANVARYDDPRSQLESARHAS